MVDPSSSEPSDAPARGTFVSHASVSLTGNVIAAAVSVAYMSIVGHALRPADYGVVVAALSMAYILSLLLAPLETGVTKLAAAAHGASQAGSLHTLAFPVVRRLALPCALILAAWWPLTHPMRGWLHLTDGALVLVGVMSVLSVPNAIVCGVMRGDHRFFDYSVARVVDSVARLAVGVAAIALGARAGGALAGYVVGIGAALVFALWRLRDVRRFPPTPVAMGDLISISLPLVFAFLFFAFTVNFDVLAAKHYLSPDAAGVYGAAATLVRMIYLAATPLYQVLFSHVTARHAQNRHTRRLTIAVAIVMGLGLLASLVIPYFLGARILGLLFGSAYAGGAKVLFIMWLSTSLLVLEVVFALALIGVNRTRGAAGFIAPCALMVVLVARHHAGAIEIATCSLAAVASGLLVIVFMAASARPAARA